MTAINPARQLADSFVVMPQIGRQQIHARFGSPCSRIISAPQSNKKGGVLGAFREAGRTCVARHRVLRGTLARMSKEHAIQAAQQELSGLGLNGTVIDVYRPAQRTRAVIVLSDGKEIRVSGHVAIKLSAMLRSNYLRWRRYAPSPKQA
jgi:hypothetical protein